MFEPEVFLKQMYCDEEITCDTVGLFGAPAVNRRLNSDSAPGELCSLAPLVTLLVSGASQRLLPSVLSAIRFPFLDLTCVIVENVLSPT